MKAVLMSLMLLAVVFTSATTTSKAFQRKINDLHESRMGKTLLNLASLHAMVQGPIDELL